MAPTVLGRWLRVLVVVLEITLVMAMAITPAFGAGGVRTWRDESGKFEVRAELLDFDGEKVRLAKEDGKEITVPISRLCAADRAHVRRLMKSKDGTDDDKDLDNTSKDNTSKDGAEKSGPGRSGTSAADDGEEQAEEEAGEAGAKQNGADVVRLRDIPAKRAGKPKGVLVWPTRIASPAAAVGGFVADPGPAFAPIGATCAVEVGELISTQHASHAVPLDTDGRRFLVSVIGRDSGNLKGRIFVIDTGACTATVVQETKELYEILDHDIESGMTLLGERGSKYGITAADKPTRLALASGFPEGKPEVKLVRDCPQIDKNIAAEVVGARLLSDRHALVSLTTSAGIWELDTGKALQVFSCTGQATASGGLRFVAIPTPQQVVVIEPATRRTVLTVHTALTVSGMAFDPAGQKLAIVEPGWVTIQDCVAGGDPVRFQSPEATGSVSWVGPTTLLTGSGALIDVERKAVLWKYQMSTGWSVSGSTVAARELEKTYFLAVPHPPVEARRATWTPVADPILLRHGDAVKIASEVSEGVQIDRAALEQTLADIAQRAGYRVADDAAATLVARLDRLAPRTVRLGFGGFGIGPGSGPGGPPTMEANPLVASIEFRTPSGVAWSDNLVFSSLPVVMLQQNESLEQGIRRLETPSIAPFAAVALPTMVERAEVAAGRGGSQPDAGGWKDMPVDASKSRHDQIVDTDRQLRETIAETNRIREKAFEQLRNPSAAIDPKQFEEAVREGAKRDLERQAGGTASQRAAAGLILAVVGVTLVLAFAMAAAVWIIFTKAGRQGWECVIPFYNNVVFLDIAGLPAWLMVFYFLPQIGAVIVSAAGLAGTAAGLAIVVIGILASTAAYALNCHGLARNFGKGIGFACGLFFLPFVFMPILAFGSARYRRR
jgi:hypothetical protein